LAAYGTFVSTSAAVQVINADGSVNLNDVLTEAPVGMTYNTLGGPTVTLTNAGVYRVDYRIRTTEAVAGALMELRQGDAAVTNSSVPVPATAGETSGVAIIRTTDGNETIAIGIATAQVTLATGTGAFLDITRIA